MALRPGSPVPAPLTTLPKVALAGDHTRQEVAARVRRGQWHRVGRGAYLSSAAVADRRRVQLARIVGVHRRLRAPHVFSHDSAALLWGLPLWSDPDAVHVYQAHRPGAGRDATLSRHLGSTAPADAVRVAGLPVTSLERTVLDCASTMRPLAGLVVVDAGLRAGVLPGEILRMIGANPGGRGMARARAVLDLADAGAESAQETAVRFVLLRAGLPRPQTQVRVETRAGTFWADLGWEQWRALVEYDGRPKYTGPEALIREKRRHDAIVEAGWRVVRVTREDLRTPALLVGRLRRILPRDVPMERRPQLSSRWHA
ncbi:MAG TPA: hypothetical protein VGC04_11860 [Cellulomonas sp.]